jgi:eukaryotic-like serine/threonine-protein kinase
MGFISQVATFFRLLLLFGVLLSVALLAAITTIRITIHSGEEKAPSLVGLSLEQAQRVAGGMGLGLKVEDRLFNSKYAENHIVSQAPAAGDSTKTGQDLHVLVSLGTPSAMVPTLVGGSVRAAQLTVAEHGLSLGDVATVHWPGIPADDVVAQDPPPSPQPARAPAVNLLVSLGEPAREFVCPNFVGMGLAQAQRTLSRAGFTVADTKSAPPPAPSAAPGAAAPAPPATSTSSGTILSQSPAAGSRIAAGTSFSFTVAQ